VTARHHDLQPRFSRGVHPDVVILRAESTAVVCDDQPAKRRAVTQLLGQAGYALVVETSSLTRLKKLVAESQPDLIVFDLALAGLSGLDVVGDLHGAGPAGVVIVLSEFTSLRADAVAAGATALVDVEDLRELETVLAGLRTPLPRAAPEAMDAGTPARL